MEKKTGGNKFCDCGCGQIVNPGCRYIFKHQNKSEEDRRRISAKLTGRKRLKKPKCGKDSIKNDRESFGSKEN